MCIGSGAAHSLARLPNVFMMERQPRGGAYGRAMSSRGRRGRFANSQAVAYTVRATDCSCW